MCILSVRFRVFLLVCFAALFSFGDQSWEDPTGSIQCHASDPYLQNGSWYVLVSCNGHLITSEVIALEGYLPGGDCSNCTAMSPEECQQHKTRIKSDIDNIVFALDQERSKINLQVLELKQMVSTSLDMALSRAAMITTEGNDFESYPTIASIPGSSNQDRFNTIAYGPTGQYIDLSNVSTAAASTSLRNSNNSVYNYYNNSVKGAIDDVASQVMSAQGALNQFQVDTSGLDEISSDLSAVRFYVENDIDCSACKGSSGGGGGGGGGGGSSSECPCSEVLTHIKHIVLGMSNDVAFIKIKIDKWDKYFDTFKAQMKVITDAIAPIGTNFVAAVRNKDLDGQSFSWSDLDYRLWHGNPQLPFDFGEYNKLSWFSRVEYSLLYLMGVFGTTNDVAEINRAKDRADEAVDGHSIQQSEITQAFDSLSGSSFNSIRDSFMTMFMQFSFYGSGRSSIQGVTLVRGDLSAFINGLSDASVEAFAGNQELIQLSDRFILLVRYAFQLIYLAVFSFLAYVLVVFLYGRIAQLVMWICSFYASVFGT